MKSRIKFTKTIERQQKILRCCLPPTHLVTPMLLTIASGLPWNGFGIFDVVLSLAVCLWNSHYLRPSHGWHGVDFLLCLSQAFLVCDRANGLFPKSYRVMVFHNISLRQLRDLFVRKSGLYWTAKWMTLSRAAAG